MQKLASQIATQATTLTAPACETLRTNLYSPTAKQSIDSALRSIFPAQGEESRLQKARAILHDVATDVTDDQLEVFITELQHLLDVWFTEFEESIFDGLTLQQVLRGG